MYRLLLDGLLASGSRCRRLRQIIAYPLSGRVAVALPFSAAICGRSPRRASARSAYHFRMALLPHVRVWATLGLVCASLLLCLPPQVSAVAINQTIDDNDPAVRYLPADSWALNSNCSTCLLEPSSFDLSQVYDGTWHDATAIDHGPPLNLSFSFTGTSRSAPLRMRSHH
jgi:hypothetical protein